MNYLVQNLEFLENSKIYILINLLRIFLFFLFSNKLFFQNINDHNVKIFNSYMVFLNNITYILILFK